MGQFRSHGLQFHDCKDCKIRSGFMAMQAGLSIFKAPKEAPVVIGIVAHLATAISRTVQRSPFAPFLISNVSHEL